MTNGQNAVMSGAKHRLNLISNPNSGLTEEQINGHKNWVVMHLHNFITEYNYAKYVTEVEREMAK